MLAEETETGGNKASANRRHLTGNRANNARPRLLLSPRSSVATNIVTFVTEEEGGKHHLSFRAGGPRPID